MMDVVNQQPPDVNSNYERLAGVSTKNWFPLVRNLGLAFYGGKPREVMMRAGDPDWEKLKKIREITVAHLSERAINKPNSPFVQIEGIGYVEVPVSVAAALTDAGVGLGTPFSSPGQLEAGNNAFRYVRNTFGLRPGTDNACIMWAGTAGEAFTRLEAARAKSRVSG